MGIIKSLKDRYKKGLGDYLYAKLDNEYSTIKSINLKDGKFWTNSAWSEIPEKIVSNCWKKTGLISETPEDKTENLEFYFIDGERLRDGSCDSSMRDIFESINFVGNVHDNEISMEECITLAQKIREAKDLSSRL